MRKIIFVIDDDHDMLNILRMCVTECGYRPLVYSDWLMARESYKELYADVALVIIDIRLEGSIGGLTLSDMIRSINPNQPILHISGYTKPDDKRITHFLGKPFWINDFKLAVERAING